MVGACQTARAGVFVQLLVNNYADAALDFASPPLAPASAWVRLPGLSMEQVLSWAAKEVTSDRQVATWSDPCGGLTWAMSARVGVADAASCRSSNTREHSLRALGSGFDPARAAPGGPWSGWPASFSLAPERLVVLDTRGARLLVGPDDDPEVVAREVLAEPRGGAVPADGIGETRELEPPASFEARVAEATVAIARGELEKVVLARAVRQSLQAGRSWDAGATLRALRAADPRAIVFAFAPGPGLGCFLGATPELLVRVEGRRVETQALAGTRPRDPADAAGAAGLLADEKARREHALVLDALLAGLAPACVSLERSADPGVVRLPHLLHLETRVAGTLERTGRLAELVARLHPTPAVCGAPREAALAWLRAHEPLERGWYAGPIGWSDARGNGAIAVALRCALLRGGEAFSFAGAGIVAGSEPAAELAETALKLRTIGRALRVTP